MPDSRILTRDQIRALQEGAANPEQATVNSVTIPGVGSCGCCDSPWCSEGYLATYEAVPSLIATAEHYAARVEALEADVARLRAIIAAERGVAAPEGWQPAGDGWFKRDSHIRNVSPRERGALGGGECDGGTWWKWRVDGWTASDHICSGWAPTALDAMEAADAAVDAAVRAWKRSIGQRTPP